MDAFVYLWSFEGIIRQIVSAESPVHPDCHDPIFEADETPPWTISSNKMISVWRLRYIAPVSWSALFSMTFCRHPVPPISTEPSRDSFATKARKPTDAVLSIVHFGFEWHFLKMNDRSVWYVRHLQSESV